MCKETKKKPYHPVKDDMASFCIEDNVQKSVNDFSNTL